MCSHNDNQLKKHSHPVCSAMLQASVVHRGGRGAGDADRPDGPVPPVQRQCVLDQSLQRLLW